MATAAATLAVMLAVAAVAFWIAQHVWPDARFISLLPAALPTMSGAIAILVVALAAALVVLARYLAARATEARSERIGLILDEGFRGAKEVVEARRQRAGLSVHRASATSPKNRPHPCSADSCHRAMLKNWPQDGCAAWVPRMRGPRATSAMAESTSSHLPAP